MTYITDKVTLYLVSKDQELQKRGEKFIVYQNGEKIKDIPAMKIKDIVVLGKTNLSDRVVGLCKTEKINVHFVSLSGKYYGSLVFDPTKNIFVRLEQYKRHLDPVESVNAALKIIKAKTKNQEWFLKSYNRKISFDALDTDSVRNYEELLGLEGSKTRQYFQYWDKEIIKNKDFIFEKRSKHPPENELNAILSLCYTLLMNEIHTMCNIVGLDPYIGFLHKNYYGRPSLVCDLVEPYRPFIDKFVVNMVNRNEIKLADFKKNTNEIEIELTKDGFSMMMGKWTDFFKKKDFYSGILGKECHLNEIIETDIRVFAKFLLKETEDFIPFCIGEI
jgi:CRISPR-associated protein Cas1